FPEGPPVSGIMIFYRMRPIGGMLKAGDDAADAKVFAIDELPLLPFRTHREIIAEWLERHHEETGKLFSTPLPHQVEFLIRPAEPKDIDEIIGLMAMIPANRKLTTEQWRDVALRIIESPTLEVFVAQTRREPALIIGCVSLSVVRALTESRGFINDMAVLPTYQRRGVGAELLEAILRRSQQLNLMSLMVNTQRANDQARAFYAASGFSDSRIMRLKIR
ncbi:MAG: GNAT family N-acetyltransferase, partial [Aggregatilineales bacterium]